MSKRTYTEHKLTESMLKQLNRCANGRGCAGTPANALERRGLVQISTDRFKNRDWITDAGRQALAKARAEGW